jgi:nucleolar protein 4
LLSSVGPIRVAFIVTSGQATASGQEPRSKGYGFAKFVLKDDAERAIQELNGTLIDGKKITVQWAKRRHRGEKGAEKDAPDAVDTNADFVSLNGRDGVENVKNAYAARREQKRAKQDGEVPAVDNYKDARAVIIEGGLDVSDAATKKALQKKLKKVVFGINTGTAALQVHDIAISAATTSLTTSNNEEGQATTINVPQTVLECPTPKVANELAEKLHNTVLKGQLLLAKVKFESDLVERKGMSHGGGRLIVRNLGFDVRLLSYD